MAKNDNDDDDINPNYHENPVMTEFDQTESTLIQNSSQQQLNDENQINQSDKEKVIIITSINNDEKRLVCVSFVSLFHWNISILNMMQL